MRVRFDPEAGSFIEFRVTKFASMPLRMCGGNQVIGEGVFQPDLGNHPFRYS
jgi:hypothetical protein